MAFLDQTVVNVALPRLGEDLDAGFSGLQWVLDGYLLTLSTLLLLGGSLGDRFGRRRMLLVGITGFTLASIACGAAPSIGVLVVARLVQGAGAALMVPNSLALVAGGFHGDDRDEAIGTWTAWSGVTTALGPFVGGWLVDAVSWRAVFFLNVPLAVTAAVIAARSVPEIRGRAARRPDVVGAGALTLGLGAATYALIEGPGRGFSEPLIVAALGGGVVLLVGAWRWERHTDEPMVPLELFRDRRFTGANLATLAVYAGLSTVFFLLILELQRVLDYSAFEAGAALLPVNVLLLVISPRAGRYARRHGHRRPVVVGATIAAIGVLLAVRVEPGADYLTSVLPVAVVFGLGLALTVAPITAAALGAVPDDRQGVASGVNNAVARFAGLVAVAAIPLAAGISSTRQLSPDELDTGVARAMTLVAASLLIGALIAWRTLPSTGTAAANAGAG